MAYVLLVSLPVPAIQQLQRALVACGNATRQLVACALITGCASGTMSDPDGAPGPDVDARVPPDIDAAVAPADAAPPTGDGAPPADAEPSFDAPPTPDGAPEPYRHVIAIDGVNDFLPADESFFTTSAGYGVYVTWDDTNLYLAYDGGDVASADANRWVLVFFDVDPGAGTGALVGEQYNTQRPAMPTGFGAEYYFRWRASNDFQDLQSFATDVWSDTGVVPATFQSGTFVETSIPLAALGSPTSLGITSLMINETPLSEGSYAGLYADSFTDGYYDATTTTIPLTKYLEVDFASTAVPNDPTHQKP